MVLTVVVVVLWFVAYAVGAASGVLQIRRQPRERLSSTAWPRGRAIWTLRIGGFLLAAGSGFLYIWLGHHRGASGTFVLYPYRLTWDLPIWLHNRRLRAAVEPQ